MKGMQNMSKEKKKTKIQYWFHITFFAFLPWRKGGFWDEKGCSKIVDGSGV